MRYLIYIPLSILFFIGSPIQHQPDTTVAPPIPKTDHSDHLIFKVLRVEDANTVVLDIDGEENKIDLVGVVTVEHYKKEAIQFLENLLKGEQVYLEYNQKAWSDAAENYIARVAAFLGYPKIS